MKMNIIYRFVYVWTLSNILRDVYCNNIPLQKSHVTKYIEKCPDEGYFFKRDLQVANNGICYLCFCKSNNTAICWQRNNRKCNAESYQPRWPNKRVSRTRRSLIDFTDLFMKDASKDVFKERSQRTCKPNEASYSEGCPPEDWCVGCTVCDCNSQGKWDCHLLSFCSDADKKKSSHKNYKGELQGHFYDPFEKPKTSRAEREKSQRAVQNLAEKMAQARQKQKIGKNNSRRYFFKNGTLVNKTIFDLRKRKKSPNVLNQTPSEVQRWSSLNMKIRKIPDQEKRQKIIEKTHNNAQKITESANFFVRKIPNKKTKQFIHQQQKEAVNVLAKRQPKRKKKRHVLLPSGMKIPKELLDKLPPSIILPTKDSSAEHSISKGHIKRVLTNQLATRNTHGEAIATRSLKSNSKATDKIIVKRSLKSYYRNKKNVSHLAYKPLKKAEPPKKKTNFLKKQVVGLKNNSKKRSLKITLTKSMKKTNSKSHYVKEKNKNLKDNNLRISNDKTPTMELNTLVNKKPRSKDSNKIRSHPKDLRKSFRNSNRNKLWKRSNHNNNTTEKIQSKNDGTKKHTRRNVKVKKDVKNKILNSNSSKDNKNIHKKPIKTQKKNPKKSVLNKVTVKQNHLRDKRSYSSWVKTVTEGNTVLKIATTEEKQNKYQTSTKKPEKTVENQDIARLKQRKLDEQVQKIAKNIQTSLNKKVLEVVGQMLGQNLTQQSITVKRSAVFKMEAINKNDSEMDGTSTSAKSKNISNHFDKENQLYMINDAYEKPSLSLKHRIKRSPNDDAAYDKRRLVPFIVKQSPVLPVIDTQKGDILMNQSQVRFTPSDPQIDETLNRLNEVDKYFLPITTSEVYLTADKNISAPFSNSRSINSDLIDIYVPIKKSRKIVDTLQINNMLSAKNRHRRSANLEFTQTTNHSTNFNESPTTSVRGPRNIETTDYYKYDVDHIRTINKQTSNKYVTEVVEVSPKNVAGKRSIHEEIEKLPDFGVVKNTSNAPFKLATSTMINNENRTKNNTIISGDDIELNVQRVNISNFNPKNVLDDKVVIIKDTNDSLIDRLIEVTNNSLFGLVATSESLPTVNNKTVLGIEYEKNLTLINVNNNGKNESLKTNNSHDDPNLFVDSSVVIIREPKRIIIPTNTSSFINTTTEFETKDSNIPTQTEVFRDDKESSTTLINENTNVSTENNEILPLVYSSTDFLNEDEFASSTTSKTQSTKDLKTLPGNVITKPTEVNLIVRETEYRQQITTEKISNKSDKSSNDFIDKNDKQQDASVQYIASKQSEIKPFKTDKNKIRHDIKQKLAEIQLKKMKLTNQIAMDVNLTVQSNPKHAIKDNVVTLEEKEPAALNVRNDLLSSNVPVPATDPHIMKKDHIMLETRQPNIAEEDKDITKLALKITDIPGGFNDNEVINLRNENISQSNFQVNKVKTNDIKKLQMKIKKHRLKKILNTLHNRTDKDERYLVNEIKKQDKILAGNKTNDLKSFFKKLLSTFKLNKPNKKQSSSKRSKILKFFAKFFKKIFLDNKTNKTLTHQLNRRKVIETLCKSFGPCKINVKNKLKLQSHIDHLNSETYKMLRSIKIIKGLLVDLAKNDKNINNETNFISDVQKLHIILKGTYSNSDQTGALTDTEKIQIEYIKNSTQHFIQAAAKFIMILNEIIDIITAPGHKTATEDRFYPTLVERQNLNITKLLKSRNITRMATNTDSSVTLVKLKELISRYSLIQSTFMRKIYNILNDLDHKRNNQKKTRSINTPTETTSQQRQNNTEEIQMYTKNIIQNLRKLRDLAHNLNKDSAHVRRKRDLHNGNLEYILMLMEYLLKKQLPTDNAGDGIDLLIDAIKKAPNIDTIKQQMLPKYMNSSTKPLGWYGTIFKSTLNRGAKPKSKFRESIKTKPIKEVSSESDSKTSKEENVTPSLLEENTTPSLLEESKVNMIDQVLDDDPEEQEVYVFDRKAHSSATIETTTLTHDRGSESKWGKNVASTDAQPDVFYNTISDSGNPTKTNGYSNDDEDAKLNFFDRYTDEAPPSETPISTIAYTTKTHFATESSTKTDDITNPPSTPLTQSIRHFYNNGASKPRIDWIDESYEEETRETHPNIRKGPPPPNKSRKTIKLATKMDSNIRSNKSEDVSGLSREVARKSPMQDILYKKQIDLLNSLDYGTEKRETDMSVSRDSGSVDKYLGDPFNQYFREEKI